jgi:hypothetical protein
MKRNSTSNAFIRLNAFLGLLLILTLAVQKEAFSQLVVFDQGFETNIDGWYDPSLPYGTVTRVSSGTDGVPSSTGSWHAIMGEDATDGNGPFTRFGGYQSVFSGGFTAEIDVYLDVNMAADEGFDYSVAVNNQSGTHLRDFIWHVGQVSGTGLLVNASNNTDFTFNSWKLLNENGGDYYTITSSGWYTLKTVFYANVDVLAVDYELYNASGTLLHTITRSTNTDLISSVVGGNRYGWFTYIDVTGDLHVDETRLAYVDDLPVHNTTQDDWFSAIQPAIDGANPGDTIEIAAGTYDETIDIHTHVDLVGTASSDPTTIITGTGGSDGVINLNASGISAADPVLLKNLKIMPDGKAGISVGTFTAKTGTSVSYVKMDNVQVIGTATNPCTEQERGIYVDQTSSIDELELVDCKFNQLTYGWYFHKSYNEVNTSSVSNVTVTTTEFDGNLLKGIYAEKLSDALFDDCLFTDNGNTNIDLSSCSYFQPWKSGIDINLKNGTYQNIAFDEYTVTGNAIGEAKEGVGLTVKARDDGSYASYPATVDNIDITNSTITGNERGIRIGEPGKNNATPTTVNINNNDIHSNVQTYSGNDGSAYGDAINMTSAVAAIDATLNWWGDLCPHDQIHGNIDYIPFLDGSGGSSTLPAIENITSETVHCTIQEDIDAANQGDTLTVAAGTYAENLLIAKGLVIIGEGSGVVIITPDPSNYGIRTTVSNISLSGFTVQYTPPLSSGLYGLKIQGINASNKNTNIELDDIVVLDSYRSGIDLNGIDGATISNCEVQNAVYGVGFGLTDCDNVVFTDITTSGNAWAGVGIYTYGRYYLLGSENIEFNGTNTFGESTSMYTEKGNYGDPGNPEPIENLDLDNFLYAVYNTPSPNHTFYVESQVKAENLGVGFGTTSAIKELASQNWFAYDGMGIQPGIALSWAGDTLNIDAGTYVTTGQVVIDSNLTVLGVDKTTVTIKPDQDFTGGSATDPGWFLVNTGIEFNLQGVTMDGDYPARNVRMGLLTYGTGTIEDNIFTNIMYPPPAYDGRGVVVFGDVTIQDNEFSNIGRIGVHIRKAYVGTQVGTATVKRNTFTGKGPGDWLDYGIEVGAASYASLDSNNISACEGIASVDGSTSAGILATDYYGVGTSVDITNSVITGNSTGIYVGYADPDATIANVHYCDLSGNGMGMIATPNTVVDAENNYWGNCPSDYISGPVDYIPFLDAPPPGGSPTNPPVENLRTGDTYCKIQDAVDEALPGDSIVAGDGTYTENVSIDKSIVLLSQNGRDFTTIQGIDSDGPETGTIWVADGVNDLTIGGYGTGFHIVGIDNSNPAIETAAIYLSGPHDKVNIVGNEIEADGEAGLLCEWNAALDHIVIDSNIFSGKTFRGVEPAGLGFSEQFSLWNVPRQLLAMGGGESVTNSDSVAFINNTIVGITGGINADGREQGNNLITIDVLEAVISGNTFDGTTTRYGSSLRARGSNTDIYDNDFYSAGLSDSCSHIYLGDGSALTGATHAPTLAAVADSNTYDGAAYISNPAGYWNIWHTLQIPIYAAPADATVTAVEGTLTENGQIHITKNVVVQGAGKIKTIIKPSQNTGTSGDARGWWLVDQDINLELHDLTLDGTGYKIYQGIRHKGTGTIDSVCFNQIQYDASGPYYNGIAVAIFGGTSPQNVDISNSTFTDIGRVGALYFGSSITNSLFSGNTYTGKGPGNWLDYALDISAGAQVHVHANTISNNKGIAASDGSASGGILVTTFYGGGTYSRIMDNTITNNSTGIIVGYDASDASTVSAVNNRIYGNDFGLSSTNPVVDADTNYWGHEKGATASTNPCGMGDEVTDNVNYNPYWKDMSMTMLEYACSLSLPFIEDWESNNGTIQNDGTIYTGTGYAWDFSTDKQGEGRLRYGTNAYQTFAGNGAMTFDKYPNTGQYATSCVTLTLDLQAYATSSSLALSFKWADHADEDHPEDKVMVRGSDSDAWVEIYDLNPAETPNGVWQSVSGLDIDAILGGAGQTVSSTFQLRFCQKDNSFTPGDGISFDDIMIEETGCTAPIDLTACDISGTTANLSWTETGLATAWEIRLGPAGFDTTGVTPAAATNPVQAVGLSPSSLYEWYVRADCGAGEYSDWEGPHTFLSAPGSISAATLPFVEDWESNDGDRNTVGNIYAGASHYWDFFTSIDGEGYASWGTNAFLSHQGSGALSMDKYPSSNDDAENASVLTLDLSAYTASSILEMSFWWVDHGEDEHEGDKVWIRGSDCDEWLEVYDLDPESTSDDTYQFSGHIDIDAILGAAGQTVSATFQVKFGQQDNSSYPGDGISYDDIMIAEGSGITPVTLPFVENFESDNGFRNTNGSMFSGAHNYWDFETNVQGQGYGYWGDEAYQVYNGSGALSMDKRHDNTTYAINHAIMTLDLSNYTGSTGLEMSFYLADHADEEQPNDKVWIRGNNSETWVEVYDMDNPSAPNHTYQLIDGIDIDDALANAGQSVSSTFQVRFGQEDNSFAPGDGISVDDLTIIETGGSGGSMLPFFEDWESNNGQFKFDGNVYTGTGYSWDYENDNPGEGRLRVGTNAYQTYEGSGAMSLDKHPNDGDFATNFVTLTLDISAYSTSTDLELSFYWADHKDENQAEDKVWIRGSNTDPWVEIYDLNPASAPDHVYQLVSGLDIDATLAGAGQSISSTFQVRFGQKDNSFTAPGGDGLSFDNILIEENAPPKTGVLDLAVEVYPNPFSHSTTITFINPADQHVIVSVYNVNGELVEMLHEGNMMEGKQHIQWDGEDRSGQQVAQGMYIVRIISGTTVDQKTIVRTK